MAAILNVPPHCFKAEGIWALIRPDVSPAWPRCSHAGRKPKPLTQETGDEKTLAWPLENYTHSWFSPLPQGLIFYDLDHFRNKWQHIIDPELRISSSSRQGRAFSHLQQVRARGLLSCSFLGWLTVWVNHVEQWHQAHSILESGNKTKTDKTHHRA